jgi:hypothetical protein
MVLVLDGGLDIAYHGRVGGSVGVYSGGPK